MSSQPILIALLLTSLWGHSDIDSQHRQIGAWSLRVETDRFSDVRKCQLSKGGVDYQRRALIFHLWHRVDTSNAIYRIDGGPPSPTRSDAMDLAHLGFALHNDDLSNPSGGLVRIPEQRLVDAREVSIEAKAMGASVSFKIDGFGEALAAARSAGCTADDFN